MVRVGFLSEFDTKGPASMTNRFFTSQDWPWAFRTDFSGSDPIIVVPTSLHPIVEHHRVQYLPSWVELSIMAGTFSGFVLAYMVATKFFPIISIWEIQEGREKSVAEVAERVEGYLPDDIAAVQS